MVEHAAVNRRVAGSSPARGAKGFTIYVNPFFFNSVYFEIYKRSLCCCLRCFRPERYFLLQNY